MPILNDIRRKPWNRWSFLKRPSAIYKPVGMLGWEERRCLYWIGRNYYSGVGAIVDAGAYIGASAVCLAAGVASQRSKHEGHVIHSFDYFKAFDSYVAKDISRAYNKPINEGDDTLALFLEQTKPYAPLINAVAGDFLAATWCDTPIEVLFIDVAKTQQLNAHVIREFFPHLIPGQSLVIQQDFYHPWHPYIHISMEKLGPYFDTLDPLIRGQSRLYLLREAIPPEVIEEVAAYRYSFEERMAALDALIAREPAGEGRAMAEVVAIFEAFESGRLAEARRRYSDFSDHYRHNKRAPWQQAREVAAHIDRSAA